LAGADIVAGKVAVSFGSQGGAAFDVVVSQGGPVTGVIGGTSGGYITGSASGDSLSYSWQANGASGTGTGTVDSTGQLSGTSNQQNCSGTTQSQTWDCQATQSSAGNPTCHCTLNADGGTTGSPNACASMPCCFWKDLPLDTKCECVGSAQLGSLTCSQYVNTANGDPTGTVFNENVIPQCPPEAAGGGAPTCTQSWQAAPDCLQKSVSGACLTYDFPDLSGTCSGSNPSACVPPPGGCACPPSPPGGCTTCGKTSTCCVP